MIQLHLGKPVTPKRATSRTSHKRRDASHWAGWGGGRGEDAERLRPHAPRGRRSRLISCLKLPPSSPDELRLPREVPVAEKVTPLGFLPGRRATIFL